MIFHLIMLLTIKSTCGTSSNTKWLKANELDSATFPSVQFRQANVAAQLHCASFALSTTNAVAYCYKFPKCSIAINADLVNILGQDKTGAICFKGPNLKTSPEVFAMATEGNTSYFVSHSGYGSLVYQNYYFKTWLRMAPSGHRIRLTVVAFSTENNYDFVQIYDGASTNDLLLAKWSGTVAGGTAVISSGNYMYITFKTDQLVQAAGFKFSYTVA